MADISQLSDHSGVVAPVDIAQSARTEAFNSMGQDGATRVAFSNPSLWPDLGFTFSAAPQVAPQDIPVAAPQVAGQATPQDAAQTCPGNPALKTLMDKAARNIYDPTSLGNVNDVIAQNPCVKSTDEAIKLADDAVAVAKDPYTDVLSPSEARALKESIQGKLTGVGLAIGRQPDASGKIVETGPIYVQKVFPNSPAMSNGMKKGDLITAVDGISVDQQTPDEVAKRLRGEAGTNVKVSVTRDGKPIELDITRAEYSFDSVSDKRLPGDIAYINYEDMGQQDSSVELAEALERHKDAKAIILDLRDNPGGLLPNAFLSASLIMEKGEVVSIRSRVDSDPSRPRYATERYLITPDALQLTGNDPKDVKEEGDRLPDLVNKPLIVLTNEGTASAAEILAGALKDNKEAHIIGTTTFGKGVGQNVFSDMPGGSALKVTNFRFFTPSGEWIGDGHNNRTGITPHQLVQNPRGAEKGAADDAQLQAALAYIAGLK